MIRALLHALGFGKPTALSSTTQFVAGDLVSVVAEDNQFGVVKVLASDAQGVHARLYVQRFARRPHTDELGELSTAPFGAEHANPFSIGHMPLSYASFADWEPELIVRGQPLADEELDGYRLWLAAGGGYF